jgi:iron(III) transport system permease protein
VRARRARLRPDREAKVNRWRAAVALVLLLLIAVPLAVAPARLAADPAGWRGWDDPGRQLALWRNTALLVAGTLALCLPPGVFAAVLLYRTDLPGRGAVRFATVLSLFVPLPLFTTAWQAVLGPGGWLPVPGWSLGGQWAPWAQGIGAAVWVHAVAGFPWVVLLAGQGLRWVERELEEDALTAALPWRVLGRVTLPRSAAAIAAAAVWVGLQAATEITVTDVMQVRTFAEEVYTQFVGPEADAGGADVVARAVAVTLPSVLLTALVVVALARRWERALPPRAVLLAPPLLFRLGPLRWPLALLMLAAGGLFLAVPVGGLLWRAGLSGAPPAWSAPVALHALRATAGKEYRLIADSLLVAGAAGALCAGLGLVACWLSLGARRFRSGVLVLMAVAWSMPGPVLGLGLKAAILQLLSGTGFPAPLARLLWDGPSYAPVLWVDLIRFFPCAVAVLWPVVRLLPRDLLDAARLDGAPPGAELARVVAPLTASAWLRAALVVAVLSLGELSAGKLVSTPDAATYAQEVFVQMHYGVTNNLAAQCLLLLAGVAAVGGLVARGWRVET